MATNFDPNFTLCGGTASQVVHLVFGKWEYRQEMYMTVKGNARGLSVISAAVSMAYDYLLGRCTNTIYAHIELVNQEGDTLLDEDDEGKEIDWLEEMLISAEIISIEPCTLEEA
jgi:hypothetical protein